MPFDMTVPIIPTVKELLGDRYTPELQEAYPDIMPPFYPCGMLILCQLIAPKRRTRGGLILADETVDAERFRVQTALVRAMGPAAFRRRDTGEAWHEGDWCKPGQFIRTPLYGGDRIAVPYGDNKEEALFVTIKDLDVMGIVTGDPLAIKTLI